MGGVEAEEEWFWPYEPFLKLKTAFCEYWTSIKIKISMNFVQRVWIVAEEQWLLLSKNGTGNMTTDEVSINLCLENCYLVGGLTFDGGSLLGGVCYVGGKVRGQQTFGW